MTTAPTTPSKDGLSLALLFAGVALAVAAALFLPALHFRGADKSLLDLSAWAAVPWLTKVKILFLALAVAAAFVTRLAPLRVPLTIAAILMMFLPAMGALIAGVYQWSSLRAGIVQMAGTRSPWIDPGWGIIALMVAAILVIGSLWRAQRQAATAAA